MIASLAFIGLYAALVGIASFIEVPVGRGFGAFQLNFLIRVGSLAAAVVAVFIVHGFALPGGSSVLAGLGIGLITGLGSILYCFSLNYLPITMVVTLSNLYLAVTTLLGMVVLREPITALKIVALTSTLAGVLLLGYAPARYGVHDEIGARRKALPVRATSIMGIYIVVVGVGAFLEKPALTALDATQLNGLMAIAMTAVAGLALAARGPRLRMGPRPMKAIGVGAMIGIASVFYFLGLRGLPVSVAAASSNVYMVVTVALSIVVLRQPVTRARGGAIALTIAGTTLLALSAG